MPIFIFTSRKAAASGAHAVLAGLIAAIFTFTTWLFFAVLLLSLSTFCVSQLYPTAPFWISLILGGGCAALLAAWRPMHESIESFKVGPPQPRSAEC